MSLVIFLVGWWDTSQPRLLRAPSSPRQCDANHHYPYNNDDDRRSDRYNHVHVQPAGQPREITPHVRAVVIAVPHGGRDRTCSLRQCRKERGLPLSLPWPFPLRTQITMTATIITRIAATTGTTRFKLAMKIFIGSSSLPPPFTSGSSRAGAMVPGTKNMATVQSSHH